VIRILVVEFNDQKPDLDKPQHTGDIDWIFVANYNELWLYNWYKKGQYILFTDENLDKTFFSCFMLSFAKESYINTGVLT
jgi:hypothetical protein